MKRTLILAFWLVGSIGAVVWTCWWVFALIYTRRFPPVAFLFIGLGIYCAWVGFKEFREERNLGPI
jgi:hypothetical protein